MIGKTLRSEICWANRGIVALQSLQVSYLSDLHSRFYESSKLKKWMCELCTFSQIRSQFWKSDEVSLLFSVIFLGLHLISLLVTNRYIPPG